MAAHRRPESVQNVGLRLTWFAFVSFNNICSVMSAWLTASNLLVYRVHNVSRPGPALPLNIDDTICWLRFPKPPTASQIQVDPDGIQRMHISRFLTSGIDPEPRESQSSRSPLDQQNIKRLMSRWSSGYLLDCEPRGSGSIPEVRNLQICILQIPSDPCQGEGMTSWLNAACFPC